MMGTLLCQATAGGVVEEPVETGYSNCDGHNDYLHGEGDSWPRSYFMAAREEFGLEKFWRDVGSWD